MAKAVQRYRNVVISGLAHLDAPHVLTSADIEEELAPALRRLRLRPGLMEHVAGISERRVWEIGTMPSTAAASVGELALTRSAVASQDIGVLVNTSVDRDYLEPSTASIVHGRLGLPTTALNFDLGNACLGFLNGMSLVAAMIEQGEIDHGLVVDAEGSRFVVESTIARLLADATPAAFRAQFATLTLGSGAAAMVLSRADLVEGGHPYLGGLSRAGTEHALLCTGKREEMTTDAHRLLLAGLEIAATTWKEAVDTFDWDPRGFDLYAVHQISKVHTRAICDTLNLDESSFPLIYPTFGNIGPASIPTVLSKSAQDGRLSAGDRVILMGIGSGINATAAEVLW
ncbi:MAG: 3-oxoacyl-ACP synthase III [Geodermatophilaceae bacterium]|nr:3-oxoacyl-ACP synthase III [Geodermatophilaceae bacterium]